MKKMKAIIICAFLLLILVTITCTVVFAVESYQYDMDPANGVDIMEGMEAAMILVLGGFAAFYEWDLFCTVYYFLGKPKTVARSILNILSNLSLLLQFFVLRIARALSISEETILATALLFIYVALRVAYLIVLTKDPDQEQ